MPRWDAAKKEAYRRDFANQMTEQMPSVISKYQHVDWQAAIEDKKYRSNHDYYPDYIHVGIHGLTDTYTNPLNCVAWDTSVDIIMQLSHGVTGQMLRDKMAELLPPCMPASASVLELGAGTAAGALALARHLPSSAHFTITDVSPYMLVLAQEKFKEAGYENRADFAQEDARRTSYADNSYDLVTASLLLHETPKRWIPSIIEEIYRLTKPGGWMLYADTYRGEYALNASFQEPWLADFLQINFEYEFARAGFSDLDYVRYGAGLWYIAGRKPLTL